MLKVTHKVEADPGPEPRCPSHPASAAPLVPVWAEKAAAGVGVVVVDPGEM